MYSSNFLFVLTNDTILITLTFQILADFTFLFGEKNDLVDGIQDFCNLMMDTVFPKLIKKPSNDDLELTLKLANEKENLSEGRNYICHSIV